jgi:hypothetical protein
MEPVQESASDLEMPTKAEVHVAADALRLLDEPNRFTISWVARQGETSVNRAGEGSA